MFLSPFTILDDTYTITSPIGSFPGANIYIARDEAGKEFIVKEFIINASGEEERGRLREGLLKEINLMKNFTHPGLPEIHRVLNKNDNIYLIMEYIKGQSLEKVINSGNKQVPTDIAVKWAMEICNVLNYLHTSFSSPALYKNLNPANIIVTKKNNVKVIDYGLTCYYNPDKNRIAKNYEAPEEEKTVQSDLYSLGVILYQMVTKKYPEGKGVNFSDIKSINPNIEDEIIKIVNKAVRKNPEERYKNAEEFKKDLEKYLNNYLQSNKPSSPGSPKITRDLFDEKLKEQDKVSEKKTTKSVSIGMVAIIIITIAAFFSIMFLIKRNKERAFICSQNLYNITAALEIYADDYYGKYPVSLKYLTQKCMNETREELYKKPYLGEGLRCPAGEAYIYTTNYEKYTVYCEIHREKTKEEKDIPEEPQK